MLDIRIKVETVQRLCLHRALNSRLVQGILVYPIACRLYKGTYCIDRISARYKHIINRQRDNSLNALF